MALELLPASMLKAIDLLPDAQTPVTLFTRHSIREIVWVRVWLAIICN